jgi:hypothetical protein
MIRVVKKDNEIIWNDLARESFLETKKYLGETLV